MKRKITVLYLILFMVEGRSVSINNWQNDLGQNDLRMKSEDGGQKTGSGDEWMRAPMKSATLVMDMNFTPME